MTFLAGRNNQRAARTSPYSIGTLLLATAVYERKRRSRASPARVPIVLRAARAHGGAGAAGAV